MGKILYFDCPSGISGDMTIGALIDLGVDSNKLIEELAKLDVKGYDISVCKDEKNGITGTKFNVILHSEDHEHGEHTHEHGEHTHEHNHEHPHDHKHEEHDHEHPHEHGEHTHEHEEHTHEHGEHTHEHGEHTHEHDHEHPHEHQHEEHTHEHGEHTHEHGEHTHEHGEHTHEHGEHTHEHGEHTHDHPHDHQHKGHSHEHRNLNDIESLIDNSQLKESVKNLSKRIFRHVAIAEAKIHGKELDQVHFHEVGAVDSIVDIVGTAICLDILNIDEIYSSNVHIGTGFVKCAHGLIPVPAPATLEILKNIPVYSKGVESELVTPTGAAIIKEITKEFKPMPQIEITKIGYGLGTKTFKNIPNLLRVVLGESKKKLN